MRVTAITTIIAITATTANNVTLWMGTENFDFIFLRYLFVFSEYFLLSINNLQMI